MISAGNSTAEIMAIEADSGTAVMGWPESMGLTPEIRGP
jgi:hypothetical protein